MADSIPIPIAYNNLDTVKETLHLKSNTPITQTKGEFHHFSLIDSSHFDFLHLFDDYIIS